MRLLLQIGLLLSTLSSCDYYDSRFKIVNHGKSPICFETCEDTIPNSSCFNNPEFYLTEVIMPGDTGERTIPGKNGWLFELENSKNRRLNIFTYTIDSVRKYHSMNVLNEKQKFSRTSLSLKELEARNWIVVVQ